jgi:hypothetical protein
LVEGLSMSGGSSDFIRFLPLALSPPKGEPRFTHRLYEAVKKSPLVGGHLTDGPAGAVLPRQD